MKKRKMQQEERMQKEQQKEIVRRKKTIQGGKPKPHYLLLRFAIIFVLCMGKAAVWASSAVEGSCRHGEEEDVRLEERQRGYDRDMPSISRRQDRRYQREPPGYRDAARRRRQKSESTRKSTAKTPVQEPTISTTTDREEDITNKK